MSFDAESARPLCYGKLELDQTCDSDAVSADFRVELSLTAQLPVSSADSSSDDDDDCEDDVDHDAVDHVENDCDDEEDNDDAEFEEEYDSDEHAESPHARAAHSSAHLTSSMLAGGPVHEFVSSGNTSQIPSASNQSASSNHPESGPALMAETEYELVGPFHSNPMYIANEEPALCNPTYLLF